MNPPDIQHNRQRFTICQKEGRDDAWSWINCISPYYYIYMIFIAIGFLSFNFSHAAQAIETRAREAILVDMETGAILLAKNAYQPMHPASMSKLMTLYLVFDQLRDGSLLLSDRIRISTKAHKMGGSRMFLPEGQKVSVSDLVKGVVIQSGNDASIALAEHIGGDEANFAEMMNARGREIGLSGSYFTNATGWPDDKHVMTAKDIAELARRIIIDFPDYYGLFAEKEFTYSGIKQYNRNPLIGEMEGADGLKTGYTQDAGYGLVASAARGGRRLILVLNGLKSKGQRASEAQRLLLWGIREFKNYRFIKAGDPVTQADIWLGDRPRVQLAAARDLIATLPWRKKHKVAVVARFAEPIAAPFARGEPLSFQSKEKAIENARVEVRLEENILVSVPLVPLEGSKRLDMFGRIFGTIDYMLFGSPP